MKRFQVGIYSVDVSRCKISTDDYEVIVEPKVIDVLKFLYLHRENVVSQQEIFRMFGLRLPLTQVQFNDVSPYFERL